MDRRNVLITGSSSGFGRDAAIALAERGHRVFATMRSVDGSNGEPARELSDLAQKRGWELHVLDLDVTSDASVASAVRIAADEGGTIDVLLNNAGVGNVGIQEAYTVDQARRLFDVNVLGVLRVNRAVLPHMRRAGAGHVIYLSSGLGRFTIPFAGLYSGTKWALEAIAESSSYELAPLGIQTTIVEPGAFATSFAENAVEAADHARAASYGDVGAMFEAFAAAFREGTERGEAGDPARVVEVLVSLVESDPEDRPLRLPVGDEVEEALDALNEASAEVQRAVMERFEALASA